MRGVKRIVADVGSSTTVVGAALLIACVSVGHAVTQSDPADETALAKDAAPAADATPQSSIQRDRELLAAAVRPGPQAPEVRWSDAGDAVSSWAEPTLGNAERMAGRYEPRFDFRLVQHNGESQAQVQVALGNPERAPENKGLPQNRLGAALAPKPILKQKGHWYLFAAGGSNAIGMNLLRDQSGELRRAGWTFEHVAAVGAGQAGIGWRKGPVQASIGLVEQQLSSYGRTVRDRFIAFTISISGQGVRTSNSNHTWLTSDDHYRGRYVQN